MSKLESRELKSKRPTVIVMSKLNDVTGKYEILENFLPRTEIHKYAEKVSKVYGTWDRYNGHFDVMLDYPDRIETRGIDKTKETNKDMYDVAVEHLGKYIFSADFAVSPDKTAVIEVNPNMEVTANFEVIEEKPEQKLLAEGK